MIQINKRLCSWAILVLLLSCAAKAQSVTVMTYNIRLDVASDGEDDWSHRRDFLVSQIRFYAPDIFGTQEGLPHQIAFLQQNLNSYGSEGVGREGGGKGESTHIFYDKSKFSRRQSHTFWLSETPDTVSMGWDAACLRVCTAILLKDKRSKREFWVFNTHLDHVGEKARQNGIELILKKMAAFNVKNLPVIFMGDLNSNPQSAVLSRLKTTLCDTRELSQAPPFGPEGTFNGFKFKEPVKNLIDYVFITPSPGLAVKRYAVLSDSKNLHYPSDHLPVFVELAFEKK